ncbi:MAG: hypothetical protein AVDCRST_MAG12-1049, partial [uncultured Rubrobacteraceae bacterium]
AEALPVVCAGGLDGWRVVRGAGASHPVQSRLLRLRLVPRSASPGRGGRRAARNPRRVGGVARTPGGRLRAPGRCGFPRGRCRYRPGRGRTPPRGAFLRLRQRRRYDVRAVLLEGGVLFPGRDGLRAGRRWHERWLPSPRRRHDEGRDAAGLERSGVDRRVDRVVGGERARMGSFRPRLAGRWDLALVESRRAGRSVRRRRV